VKLKRFVIIAGLAASFAGVAGAQAGDGLGRALDQQRENLERQQSGWQRHIEEQGRALQREQDWALRQQLDQLSREPRLFDRPLERPLTCPPGVLVCE